MNLITIAVVCVYLVQTVCYWMTYRVVAQLINAYKARDYARVIINSVLVLLLAIFSLYSWWLVLTLRFIKIISFACGLVVITLIVIAESLLDGG